MTSSASYDALVAALICLPGVGPKTAQRMALDLLLKKQSQAHMLARAIEQALSTVQQCRLCRNLSDGGICAICVDSTRDRRQLCIVEQPADVLAIEEATDYRGVYFVLMGHIAPLDGIGPQELGLDKLDARLSEGNIDEIVLATNSTLEGESTAYFLSELAAKHGIVSTRLAHGVPLGGELSYIDKQTLSLAFKARLRYQTDESS